MTTYPLLQGFAADSVFAWRDGQAITAADFLALAETLAEALPKATHVVNLCAGRVNFTLGFAAAMMRGQISLLPPNDTPGTLAQLAEDYPGLYCLVDRPLELGMPVFEINPLPVGEAVLLAERLREPGEGLLPSGKPLTRSTKGYALSLPASPTGRGEFIVSPEFPAGQIAALLFTSGSTGRPKPQARTWGGFVRSVAAAGERLQIASLPGATLVGTVPHQHSYGIESTVLLALQHGLAMHDARPLLPADIAAALAAAPVPRILVTTPIHLKALLGETIDLTPAALVLSATAPLSRQTARQAETALSAPLHEIYGCSEAGQLATRRTADTDLWRCFDGITLRQADGETFAQGDAVGDETRLNDVIDLAGETSFRLHGRTGDLINIAGKRSSLAHLTHHLTAIPGVIDGIFVMPEESDARLTAFVVAPGLDPAAIMAALRRHIDPAFLPRPLCFVDALPRNQLGKLPHEATQSLLARAGQR